MAKTSLREQRLLKRVLDLAEICMNQKEKEILKAKEVLPEDKQDIPDKVIGDVRAEIEEARNILKREDLLD